MVEVKKKRFPKPGCRQCHGTGFIGWQSNVGGKPRSARVLCPKCARLQAGKGLPSNARGIQGGAVGLDFYKQFARRRTK